MNNNNQEIKVGDILVCSWGYSMSLVDFYKVVKVTAKSAFLLKMGNKTVEHDSYGMYSRVMPSEICTTDKPLMRRIQRSHYDGELYCKITDYQYARKWDGQSKYFNDND